MAYRITILESDIETLYWLAARGYDGGFLALNDMAGVIAEDESSVTYAFSESAAWEYSERISNDPDAFLACCGSATLARALLDFWNDIV